MAVRRWHIVRRQSGHMRQSMDPKIAADLCPSADGSAVRTSPMAGGGYAADNQRAYSLGRCAIGQTDGRIALFQNPPPRAGHNTPELTVSVVLTLSIALNRMCVIIGSWEGGGQGYVAYKESRRETERGQYY